MDRETHVRLPVDSVRRQGLSQWPLLTVSGLTKTFDGFTAVSNVSVRRRGGRDPGPHRPERLGQEHHVQLHRRHVRADRGLHPLQGRGDRRAAGQQDLPQGHRPHLSDPAPVPQSHAARERRAVGLVRPARQDRPRRLLAAGARRRWASSGCRRTPPPPRTGSAPRRSRSWSSPARSPPSRRCCSPTRASTASTIAEMEQAADMLQRIRQREGHHHRLGRAHHGRADAGGRPRRRARSRREDLRRRARRRRSRTSASSRSTSAWTRGPDAAARRQSTRATAASRPCSACPCASTPARRWPSSAPTAPARRRCCAPSPACSGPPPAP